MIHDDGNTINDDIDYCNDCGVPVDCNDIWYSLKVPLCKECWFERNND